MPKRLKTHLTHTLTQQGALRQTLAQAECALLAWRPASATPLGQAVALRFAAPTIVTFCPTLEALRDLSALWESAPYSLDITATMGGYLTTLTRRSA